MSQSDKTLQRQTVSGSQWSGPSACGLGRTLGRRVPIATRGSAGRRLCRKSIWVSRNRGLRRRALSLWLGRLGFYCHQGWTGCRTEIDAGDHRQAAFEAAAAWVEPTKQPLPYDAIVSCQAILDSQPGIDVAAQQAGSETAGLVMFLLAECFKESDSAAEMIWAIGGAHSSSSRSPGWRPSGTDSRRPLDEQPRISRDADQPAFRLRIVGGKQPCERGYAARRNAIAPQGLADLLTGPGEAPSGSANRSSQR